MKTYKQWKQREVTFIWEQSHDKKITPELCQELMQHIPHTASAIAVTLYMIRAYKQGNFQYIKRSSRKMFEMIAIAAKATATLDQYNQIPVVYTESALQILSDRLSSLPDLVERVIIEEVDKQVSEKTKAIEKELKDLREFKHQIESKNLLFNLKRHFGKV